MMYHAYWDLTSRHHLWVLLINEHSWRLVLRLLSSRFFYDGWRCWVGIGGQSPISVSFLVSWSTSVSCIYRNSDFHSVHLLDCKLEKYLKQQSNRLSFCQFFPHPGNYIQTARILKTGIWHLLYQFSQGIPCRHLLYSKW